MSNSDGQYRRVRGEPFRGYDTANSGNSGGGVEGVARLNEDCERKKLKNQLKTLTREIFSFVLRACASCNTFTIPHSTLQRAKFLESYDDSGQRWDSSNDRNGFTIAHDRHGKSTTIEGGSGTGGDTSIGGGSGLKIAITAQHSDTEHNIYDTVGNRGGGGGGGGGASVSLGGQSPPTPTVGKTLLNTSPNLLPITTASDTFNNLKNLVKIDKGSETSSIGSGGYRPKSGQGSIGGSSGVGNSGGYKGGNRLGSPPSGETRTRSGAIGASGHFSAGFNKNSAKIRQHDSEVSPRPRRSYQSDSSSSRYYSKNSDILGQGSSQNAGGASGNGGILGNSVNNVGGGQQQQQYQNGSSGRGSLNQYSEGRRNNYQQQQLSDGGSYNRGGINANSSSGGGSGSGGGGNYRSTRYENGNGNGQQRPYGSNSSNAGYINNNNKSNYSIRGNQDNHVNSRPSHREDYGSNYRDYDDAPSRQQQQQQRYIINNSSSGSGSGSSNSLDRKTSNSNHRYNNKPHQSGDLPPSALRQGGGSDDRYDRSYADSRSYSNRTPPVGRGENALTSHNSPSQSPSVNSSSSRGISPNTSAGSSHHHQQQQQQQQQQGRPSTPPSTGRWVPPSLRPQHGLTQSEKNDAVFRRVRGILNKLTPEKFQDLSDELLKLDLNSIVILNGVILLIFDKALDEPKYSSMYAQLCKRLSQEAPSFEKDPNCSCTFLRLLIAVCRDKFNNRLKKEFENNNFRAAAAAAANDGISGSSSSGGGAGSGSGNENDSDEEERRHLAKQRMLGNVKFIGELNKLDMLSKNVLHQCIMELLDKKRKRSASKEEMWEDMECLAQLLKTCGKNLDSEQGKELMNQYFERLERRSKSTDYPPRIRFMLKDVIELRENNWIPRKVGTTEGPVPIKQIRTDDDQILRTPFASRGRDMRNNDRDNDSWMNRFHLNLQQPGGFNDMFSSLSVTGSSAMMSPFGNAGSNRPYNNNRDRNNGGGSGSNSGGGGGGGGGSGGGGGNYNNNRYNKHNNQNGSGGSGGMRDDMRSMMNRDQNNSPYNNNSNGQMLNNKELAPRFKRNLITANQDSVENLQMRPAPNSLLFKAASQNQKLPSMLPISTPLGSGRDQQSAHQQQQQQLSNSQYPLLSTPTSHLAGGANHPARPSSTPSAEFDAVTSSANANATGHSTEKGLKSTSSSPNFDATLSANERMNADGSGGDQSGSAGTAGKPNGDKKSLTASSEQLITKAGSVEKAAGGGGNGKGKKDKAFNKEEVLKKTSAYIKEKFFYQEKDDQEDEPVVVKAEPLSSSSETSEVIESGSSDTQDDKQDEITSRPSAPATVEAAAENEKDKQLNGLIEGFLELKVPEKCLKDVCIAMTLDVLERAEEQYLDRTIQFLLAIRKHANLKPNVVLEVFRQVVNRMTERQALNPRITSHVASLLSKAVAVPTPLLKLSDIANYTDNGQHYPLFLLVLQQLHKTIGKESLEEKFRSSKIDLMHSLPEADRNKTRLAEILDDRNLAFLYPLLKVQAEMLKQITTDPNPTAFYKWIRANVDAKYYKDPGFINALMTVLIKIITQESSLAEGSDIKKHPDKSIMEKEENLLLKYGQILQSFLRGNHELQLIAVYALQVFCFNENFPKGMLCRWFKYLYEAEIIDEETFIMWKEEISDKYPGKGTALFQVNNWLTWLQEAESEDDED